MSILLLSAALALGLAVLAWRRPIPGHAWFALLMLAVAEWEAFRVLEGLTVGLAAKVAWARWEYIGIASVPVLWLLFTLTYGAQRSLSRRAMVSLWFIPTLTVVIALSGDPLGLLWTHIAPASPNPSAPLVYTHGAWFWLAVAYNYLLLLFGSGVLLGSLAHTPHVFRGQGAVLLGGAALPWLGNLIYLLGRSPIPGLDLTPFAFTLGGLVWFWGLFRVRLFDLVPVARAALLERLHDGVLVVDR